MPFASWAQSLVRRRPRQTQVSSFVCTWSNRIRSRTVRAHEAHSSTCSHPPSPFVGVSLALAVPAGGLPGDELAAPASCSASAPRRASRSGAPASYITFPAASMRKCGAARQIGLVAARDVVCVWTLHTWREPLRSSLHVAAGTVAQAGRKSLLTPSRPSARSPAARAPSSLRCALPVDEESVVRDMTRQRRNVHRRLPAGPASRSGM